MTILNRLDNGLTVVLEPTDAAPVVAMQVWVSVGSADETDAEAGLAHFHEHMLFKGTARRQVGQIAREVEGVGGQINAWTSYDQTTYHLVLPAEAAAKGLDILADVIGHSIFDPKELAKESEVILEEIKQSQDHPSEKLSQALFCQLFSSHPYRRPILGTEETVRGFQREDVLGFYRKWYVPNNMVLSVAGDFQPESLMPQIEALFGAMEAAELRHQRLQEPETESRGLRLETLRDELHESYLELGFHTPAALHEDICALELLAVILGQGESSRLTQELERNRQCVNAVYSMLYSLRDHGVFLLGAVLPPGLEEEALDGILEEISRLQLAPPSHAELEKARTAVESDAIYTRQSVQGVARALGYYQTLAGDYQYEETFYRGIARVGKADIQRVARRYLRLDNAVICAMTPEEEGFSLSKEAIEGRLQELQEIEAPALHTGAHGVLRHTLSNGVRLLLKQVSHAPMASLRAVMVGGLRAEDAQNNGIGMLTSQLLNLGTEAKDSVEIAEMVDGMAASLSGFSGRNSLGLQAEFLSRTFDRGLELFAECLLEPAFSEFELERVRRLVLEQIRAEEDQIAHKAFELFFKTLYPTHPYGLPPTGTPESLAGLDRRQIEAYYRRLLNPANLVISVVGDVDLQATVERLEALLSDLSDAGPFKAPKPPLDPPPSEIREAVLYKDRKQAHLMLGFQGVTFYDPRHYAIQLLDGVLSGQGGRLFLKLRDELSLAYSVSSSSLELMDPGTFWVYIATSPHKVEMAREAILSQLDALRREPVSEAELGRVCQYITGAHAISLQYNGAQALAFALNELYGLGYDYGERYAEAIRQVRPEAIQQAACELLQLDRYVLARVQPEEPG